MTIIERILLEVSAKVDDGKPNFKNKEHIVILSEVLTNLGWNIEQKSELIGNLTNTKINLSEDKYGIGKMRKDGKKVSDKIERFIKKFIDKLNKSSVNPGASLKNSKGVSIKANSRNPRVDVTISLKNIGNGSRQIVFDEVDTFRGDLRTKYNSSNKFSSAGHVETTIDKILVRVEFKGGKRSSGEASMDTDLKEGMVGAWFQAKWNKPITKTNISDAIGELLEIVPSMTGESSKVKGNILKFLKGLPMDSPKATVLNALNETLSSALTMKSNYSSWTWERDTIFNAIRAAGSKICKMTADKWNPGDVYLMKGNKSAGAISKANAITTTSINQQIAPINNLFVSEWGGSDGSIVSISLKMQKAQAGKGKQYLKKFDGSASDFDYNLTTDEQQLKGADPDVILSAFIPQIEDWRSSIKADLSGGTINYTYSPASTNELMDPRKSNFVYQKYASMKMFAFMAKKLKSDGGVFVDAAAFSLSLTGYNPTFFKVKGDKSGGAKKAEKYEAGGGIELVDNKIEITDTNTNAGITFIFKVKNNDLGTGDMKMNIRFNGTTQATLEMLSAKWSG